jgi:hypothetical protein
MRIGFILVPIDSTFVYHDNCLPSTVLILIIINIEYLLCFNFSIREIGVKRYRLNLFCQDLTSHCLPHRTACTNRIKVVLPLD